MKQWDKLAIAAFILKENSDKIAKGIVTDNIISEIRRALSLLDEYVKIRKHNLKFK